MRKNCCNNCIDCEMLIEDESIVIFKKKGINVEREEIPAVKCGRFGQYAICIDKLPNSQILDDFIYR